MSNEMGRLKSALADRYVIEHELGAGGMATVYLAEHAACVDAKSAKTRKGEGGRGRSFGKQSLRSLVATAY